MRMEFDELFERDSTNFVARETIRLGQQQIRIGHRFGEDSSIAGIALSELRKRVFEIEIIDSVYVVRGLVG